MSYHWAYIVLPSNHLKLTIPFLLLKQALYRHIRRNRPPLLQSTRCHRWTRCTRETRTKATTHRTVHSRRRPLTTRRLHRRPATHRAPPVKDRQAIRATTRAITRVSHHRPAATRPDQQVTAPTHRSTRPCPASSRAAMCLSRTARTRTFRATRMRPESRSRSVVMSGRVIAVGL